MNGAMATMSGGLRLFGWFTLRHLRSHMGRTLAVLLGIALGAAVFTSVRLAVQATMDSYSRSMDLIAGSSDLTLFRPGGRVPDTLVASLMQHPFVHTASPVLSAYVRPADHETPFLLIGFDPILDRDLRSWTVRSPGEGEAADWASMMTQPFSLLIGAKLGQQFGWREGQSIKLVHSRQTLDFKVLALLDPDGLAMVEGGRIALCDIATFQEFTGQFGLADRIDIRLKPDAAGDASTTLQALLPAGVVMRSPSALSESGQGMIRAYQLSLTFLSFISLFVGMFLVYSLVALNAAARRRELAVMRATGASGRLLFFLFVGEGAFIGLCGWLLALPISSLLVKTLLAGVSRTVSVLFVRVQVDGLTLDPWEILLSFGVTLAVAVLAALQPAREAMRVPPREALDIAPTANIRPRLIRRMALGGLGLLVLVYPIARLPSPPSVSLPGYLAALLLFVGFALLAPLMLQQVGRLLAPRLLHLGGQPAFLAAGYLKQSGVQTAISVGALITAVALFTALVVMIHSFRSTVALWVQQSIAGDIYVRPKLAELNRFRDPLPPRVVAAVQTLPVPVELVPMHRLELQCQRPPAPFRGHGLRRLCPAQPIYLDGRRHPANRSRSDRRQGRRGIRGLRQQHRSENRRPLSGPDRQTSVRRTDPGRLSRLPYPGRRGVLFADPLPTALRRSDLERRAGQFNRARPRSGGRRRPGAHLAAELLRGDDRDDGGPEPAPGRPARIRRNVCHHYGPAADCPGGGRPGDRHHPGRAGAPAPPAAQHHPGRGRQCRPAAAHDFLGSGPDRDGRPGGRAGLRVHSVDLADLRRQPAIVRMDLRLPGRLAVSNDGRAVDFRCGLAGRPAGGQSGLEHVTGHAAARRNTLMIWNQGR